MELQRSPSPELVFHFLDRKIKSVRKVNHECHFSKCNIQNLQVKVHQQGTTYGVECLPFIQKLPWMSDATVVSQIYTLYICMDTGKVHYCHENCGAERIINADNCNVCCISGLQFEAETVRAWDVDSRCLPTIAQQKCDPHKYARDKEGRVRFSGAHNLTLTKCVKTAQETVYKLLFSPIRYNNEASKIHESTNEAKKLIGKYRRHCEKSHTPKNYMHMITIAKNRMKKKNSSLDLILIPDEEKLEIIKKYSMEVIAYYKMILMKTVLGKETPALFSFKTFTPACLYLMKTGLVMGGLYIIHPHPYLEAALPQANNLDVFNLSKSALTVTKNNILKAIRETVELNIEVPKTFAVFRDKEQAKVEANYQSSPVLSQFSLKFNI